MAIKEEETKNGTKIVDNMDGEKKAKKKLNMKVADISDKMSISEIREYLRRVRAGENTKDLLEGKEPREGLNFNPPIAFECQPKIGSYNDEGFCSEEMKIMKETKKILSMPELKVSAFTVRVPTLNGHGEAVWITFDKEVSKKEIESTLSECPFIDYLPMGGDKSFHSYKEVTGHSNAFVSRLRKDLDT